MKRFIFVVIVTMLLAAASSLVACNESCLDEYPCNVPADDPDASFDGGSTKVDAALLDGSIGDAIDDISTIDSSVVDAGSDSGDAADD